MPELGWYDFYGGPNHRPHKPACEYLDFPRSKKGITSVHLVAGRGAAKTSIGQYKLLKTAMVDMPGIPLFWFEPRHMDIENVFMKNWIPNVPEELWHYKKADRKLIIHSNPETVVDMLSRNVDNPEKKVNLGPTYGGGWIDEAAIKFNLKRWSDIKATIRHNQAPYLFLDTLSTPQKNGYYNLCTRAGQHVIHASSYDNPFIPKEAIDDFSAEMDPEYYKQEIEGRWISQEGRIWDTFSEEGHPLGNIHDAEWDPRMPWFLGMDIGSALGHWQIWQYHKQPAPYEGQVAVVVAEGVQKHAPIQVPLNTICEHYANKSGRAPVMVAIGHDVNKMGDTGGAPALKLTELGWNHSWPNGDVFYKEIQYQIMRGLILDTTGRRRWAISKNIRRHGPQKEAWGILHAMQNAQFPPNGSTETFYKDKKEAGISNTEDPMDSMLYLAAINHPPRWKKTKARAE